MQTSMVSGAKSPLELPELRARISRFVSLKDAIVCAQVCKDWNQDFTSQIWRTIDLQANDKFIKLDPMTISKHGHRIRVIKNLKNADQVAALQCSSICNLKRLSMFMNGAQSTLLQYYDILRRNNSNLTRIDISAEQVDQVNVETKLYFVVDVLAPSASTLATSRLSDLRIRGLAMTWESFSSLLRLCPVLKYLKIQQTTLSNCYSTGFYKHQNMTYHSAPLQQIFHADPRKSNSQSLLRYFPKLTRLETWETSEVLDIPSHVIRYEVALCCPFLDSLETTSQSSTLVEMVVRGFPHLASICVDHINLSPEVITAILTHQQTIERVYTFPPSVGFYKQDNVLVIEDPLRSFGWIVQLLFQTCSRLTHVLIPAHEMDISDIARVTWSCADIETLHTRIQGLDTAEKINRALRMWVAGRAQSADSTSSLEEHFTIEARVSRHLLKFKKLRSVWLGTKIWRV